ncbi:MAG: hypothetical protein HGA70_10745, partial [Chlorobiaceae bacterium]|nr:hypothetical protein [Chlorobiaceae bacterium]
TTKQGDKDVASRLVAFGSEQFADNKFLNNLYNRDLMMNAVNWAVGVWIVISVVWLIVSAQTGRSVCAPAP